MWRPKQAIYSPAWAPLHLMVARKAAGPGSPWDGPLWDGSEANGGDGLGERLTREGPPSGPSAAPMGPPVPLYGSSTHSCFKLCPLSLSRCSYPLPIVALRTLQSRSAPVDREAWGARALLPVQSHPSWAVRGSSACQAQAGRPAGSLGCIWI